MEIKPVVAAVETKPVQGTSKSPAATKHTKVGVQQKVETENPQIAVKVEKVKTEVQTPEIVPVKVEKVNAEIKQESNSMIDFEMFLQTQFGAAQPITKAAP